MNAIDACMRKADAGKRQEFASRLRGHVFDLMLAATSKLSEFSEELKLDKEGSYTKEAQLLMGFTDQLITHMLNICLAPATREDGRIWTKMGEFCKKWLQVPMLILIWQKSMVAATSTLSDNLSALPETEYKLLADPTLTPFEGLAMKKEYSLQVLYNAHTALQKVPPEEQAAVRAKSKYKDVYSTSIYKSFDIWLNLLKLIQLPPGSKLGKTLSEYGRSKGEV